METERTSSHLIKLGSFKPLSDGINLTCNGTFLSLVVIGNTTIRQAMIKHVHRNNKYWSNPSLLMSSSRIKIYKPNFSTIVTFYPSFKPSNKVFSQLWRSLVSSSQAWGFFLSLG